MSHGVPKQLPDTLNLIRGDTVIGRIGSEPRRGGISRGTAAPSIRRSEYEDVRALFERELRLLRANSSNDSGAWDDWEAIHAELHDPGLRLSAPDSSYVADEILIHINGAEAWWRE